MRGLDDVHGGAYDSLIKRFELSLTDKGQVCGIFGLHEAPVIAGRK